MKKFLGVLLVVVLLVGVLLACGDKGGEGKGSQDRDGSPGGDDADEQGQGADTVVPPPELPDLNLGGADFTIMTNDYGIPIWSQRDIGADEETGDTVNDAVYRRNAVVGEKFNCRIVEKKENDLYGQLTKYVKSGDAAIDAATPRLFGALIGLTTANYLVEFSKLGYVDLSKPWWDQNCVRDMSIARKLFGVASDMTLMDKDSTTALVFNKKLQGDYQIENLYQLVNGGKWTLDKLLELSKIVSIDVDGNGKRDDKDAYGLLYQRDSMTSFLSGCGEFVSRKDENDHPVMTLNTPKALDVLDKLFDILYDENYCFHVMKFFDKTSKGFTEGMIEMFQDDRALFMWIRMADVENLRSMDTDFGILPMPKYNEQQEKYLQTVNPYVGIVTVVPQSAASVENSGIVLEAMAYESKYILQPAYYDIVLNTKIARDEESGKMLDIIFGNRAYDIGEIFNFGEIGRELPMMTQTFKRDIVSIYEKRIDKALKEIEKLVDTINGLE